MVRTAIVGIGRWGKNVAMTLHAISDLTAYVHQESDAETAWATQHIPGAREMSLKELCADTSIKAVVVVVPAEQLKTVTEKLIRAGKHVLVEKPMAVNSNEAEHLVQIAKEKGQIINAGYAFVHAPRYQEIKKGINPEDVRELRCTWRKYGTFNASLETNLLVHHIAIMVDFFGLPTSVQNVAFGDESKDWKKTRILFGDAIGVSDINRDSKENKHTVIFKMKNGTEILWNAARDKDCSPTPLENEIASFLAEVTHGIPSPTSGKFGLLVLKVCESIRNR